MRPFVDTNVFVYAVDVAERVKRAQATSLLQALGSTVVISSQVLAEFHVTVTRKLPTPLESATARDHLHRLADLHVVPTDVALVLSAAHLAQQHQLSLWDAMILRAAATAGCDVIHTEDMADGAVIGGVRISNPFG